MFNFNGAIVVLIVVILLLAFGYWSERQRLKYLKEKIKNNWARQERESYIKECLDSISYYFNSTKDNNEFFIDNITWNDLNMNDLFTRINNTQSSVGGEFLYNMLRTPLFDEAKLKTRDKVIQYFQDNYIERGKIQFIIAKLGKNKEARISDSFNYEYTKSKKLVYYRILSVLPLIFIGLFFLNKAWIILFIISLAFNSFLHFANFKAKGYEANTITYIISLVQCADRIKKLNINDLKKYFPKAEDSINKMKSIKRGTFIFADSNSTNEMDIIAEYFKMFLLLDLIKFEKINSVISKNTSALKDVYEFVGTIDSFIAIASYRESLSCYTRPIFKGLKQLNFKDIYHPLIDDPVSNSCEVHKSILITGSNASGKSTFLKTIAINSILAQTIYTCFARSYESSFFKTYTSMAIKDDIMGSDSYYIAEIKSLKRVVDNTNDKIPCICFIDEILRGTNTIERIAASSEVLNYIVNRNCLCISATHDIKLTNILHSVFENYHFQEYIEDDEIFFDYNLYKGKSNTRNAIKLLNIMGYGSNIVSRAEKRAKHFINSGVWNEVNNKIENNNK